MYLTKSDFKSAQGCPTRLYYRKTGHPTNRADDPYLELLADGGFMVEEIARQLHPGGRLIGFQGSPEECARRTADALAAGDCILFEATLIAGRCLARVDILVRRGREVRLIEVKAASFDGAEHARLRADGRPGLFRTKSGIASKWRERIEDVAFQVMVAREALPQHEVHPFLMMPDKSRTTEIDRLWSWFDLSRDPAGASPRVRFTGDADELRKEPFVVAVDVAAEVEVVLDRVAERTKVYVGSIYPRLERLETPISLDCKECEYHGTGADGPDALFADCWGDLRKVAPNLFDMYAVRKIGGKPRVGDELISLRRFRLDDLEERHLVTPKGGVGADNRRQLIQLRHTRMQTEWVSPELPALLDRFAYPLHFIDFETSALAIPYHAGMRPYEDVAFQWSCHTLDAPGAEARHGEWINVAEAFPNIDFARSLRDRLGEGGTVFMWSVHERTILRGIRRQLAARGGDAELDGWLDGLARRLVDMNAIALEHYFHPVMKGSTSLKRVVEAVWRTSSAVRARFPEYACEGDPLASPYGSLPPLEIASRAEHVREGTGAVRAYQSMLFGADRAQRDAWRQLLLRYCRLDTAAMVMVWQHWRGE